MAPKLFGRRTTSLTSSLGAKADTLKAKEVTSAAEAASFAALSHNKAAESQEAARHAAAVDQARSILESAGVR
jgi:hypothetical protein